jgi:hypothetical protein
MEGKIKNATALITGSIFNEPMSLFQLIYVSTATEPLSHSQLRVFLLSSAKRNQLSQLTGLLLYADERFIQVLEGPEAGLKAIHSSIVNDPLHKNIDTLRFEVKQDRNFYNWRMAIQGFQPDNETSPYLPDFLTPNFDSSPFEDSLNETFRMLLAFQHIHNFYP